jgi:hypothetical protein
MGYYRGRMSALEDREMVLRILASVVWIAIAVRRLFGGSYETDGPSERRDRDDTSAAA